MSETTFSVSYPRSANSSHWKTGPRAGHLRKGVAEWRRAAGWAYKAAGGTRHVGPVMVELDLYRPAGNVPYDVDNAPFNVLNALKGVAYDDDDQVDLLVVAKMWPEGAGRVVVRVKKIRAATPPGV